MFISDLQDIAQLRAMWIPASTDTTTTTSIGPAARVWTYDATIAARISTQGSGVLVSFDGAANYATTPDTDSLSFGNGTTDGALSIVALANVTNTANTRVILAKGKLVAGTGLEYALTITGTDKLQMQFWDASASANPNRTSNAAITQGAAHLFGATYSAATGGATAANDITLYQDAAVIASTATNAAAYVAMENGTGLVGLGQSGTPEASIYFQGSLGFAALYAANLSTTQHLAVKTAANTYYGLSL